MKGWQKGAILGVLWAIVSVFVGFMSMMSETPYGSDPYNFEMLLGTPIGLALTFLFLPGIIFRTLWIYVDIHRIYSSNLTIFIYILPFIIGASFGGGIGYLYGRWKE